VNRREFSALAAAATASALDFGARAAMQAAAA